MINVYSFQKVSHVDDNTEDKNISKTSQFIFGQNYKKLIANSKASFDFRKFLQKHSQTKKHFATLANKQTPKRNPLQQVASIDSNGQNSLQNKAFKIRCYSRRTAKQNQKQEQTSVSRLIRHKPKIYSMKEQKTEQKAKKSIIENKKMLRMHKFDNFEELESISLNLKIVYNDFIYESDKITDKALIFDLDFLIASLKASTIKHSEKDKQIVYFRRKIVLALKKLVEQKYTYFPIERAATQEKPQIIFKVRKEQEIQQLLKTFDQCQYSAYYCIFSIQQRYTESVTTYNLTKINHLAQNIVIVDSLQSLSVNLPLLDSRHFVSLTTIPEKTNFGSSLENLFHSLDNLEIRFSAEQFVNENPVNGQIIEIPFKQLIEKVKQKRNSKKCKKTSRDKKQRCHSSYENSYSNTQSRFQQKTMQSFKDKMLKYLKIIESQANQNPMSLQSRKSKQLVSTHVSDQFQCITGREKCSKTNNQIVAELIRLNNHVHKQISNYQRKNQEFFGHDEQQKDSKLLFLRCQKVFVNFLS